MEWKNRRRDIDIVPYEIYGKLFFGENHVNELKLYFKLNVMGVLLKFVSEIEGAYLWVVNM